MFQNFSCNSSLFLSLSLQEDCCYDPREGGARMYKGGRSELYLRVEDEQEGSVRAKYLFYGQGEEGRWYGFGIAAGRTMVGARKSGYMYIRSYCV